jgi:hypothetical protein
MNATQPARGRSAAGAWTAALVVLLLCATAAVSACGATGMTASDSISSSPGGTVASDASPSTTPLPRGAGRGTIAFTKALWSRENSAVPPFDIYVVHSDGTGLRRLAAGARGPAWSPDGARIAYVSLSARGGLWVMDADGSGKRRVAIDRTDGLRGNCRFCQFRRSSCERLPQTRMLGGGAGAHGVNAGARRRAGNTPKVRRGAPGAAC